MKILYLIAALFLGVSSAWAASTSQTGVQSVAGLTGTPTASQLTAALQIRRIGIRDCAGQSNAAGRGIYDSNIDGASDPLLLQWDATSTDADYLQWILGNNPLHQTEGVETGLIGACQQLGLYRSQALRASAQFVGIVPVAVGSTSMVNGPWSPTAGGTVSPNPGYLYYNAIQQTNAAIAAAKAMFPLSGLDEIDWSQGESDAVNGSGVAPVTQAVYATNLDALISGFRTNMTGGTNVPFLIMAQNPYYVTNYEDGQVDLAEKDAPRRDYYTAYINRGDGLASGLAINANYYCSSGNACSSYGVAHWSAQGQRLQALMAIPALAYAQANYLAGTVPGQPTNLTAAAVYGTAVHLQWTQPVSRFTAAVVQYQVVGAGSWTTFPTPSGQFNDLAVPQADVNVTGLTTNTAYNFRVAMTNESGTGAYSATLTVTTSATVSAPYDPMVATTTSSATSTGATVTALNPYDGDSPSSYTVRYRPDGVGASYTTVTGVSLPYTITGATYPGTLYDVGVTAANSAGTGPYGGIYAQFTTTGTQTVPQTPTGVGATALSGGSSLAVTWVAATGGYPTYTYTIKACLHSTSTCVTSNTGSNAPSGTINGLVSATLYDVSVAGNNNAGTGSYSAIYTIATASFDYLATDAGATPYASCDLARAQISGETGTLLVVQNSSGTTYNIGLVNNLLDTTTLLSDAAGGTLYVKSCNDLVSGRSVNFNQSTLSLMPIIVNAGTLVTLANGTPAMSFPSGQYLASTVQGFPGAANFEVAFVAETTAVFNTSNNTFLSATDSSTAFAMIGVYASQTIGAYSSAYSSPSATAGSFTTNTAHSVRLSYTSSTKTVQEWIDGTQAITNGVWSTAFSATLPEIGAWSAHQTASFPGELFSEIAIWNSIPVTLSASDAIYTSQKTFFGTP